MDRIREVIVIRKPEPVMEIIKSSSTRGIADNEARKDGMEMVLFEVSGPFGIGSDLKFHGKQDGAQAYRREALEQGRSQNMRSVMMVSSSERSRFQNFSMITHVEGGSEEAASG